ncbi:hypothetical protein [Novosphingobium jiangmenense]|uniref:Uncharacterized protein n=1 Tax=Novosphingobium jiangmenense TaxID=2791981 RepID=A0ABS0HDF6_9SPHN|nr:hypothetical protein [Novosphingobium jiangmenense]MBF9150252.1 hypothetical protein [Novosphingobium jiangmenense]
MYEPERLPSLAEVLAGPDTGLRYFVSHAPEKSEGWAEVLGNGLTFDLRGLREGNPASAPDIRSAVGLGLQDVAGKHWLTLAPGPHLAGADRLLPVIRIAAMLLNELSKVGPALAISWIPAHLVIKPDLFARAIGPWLEGGPFPAPAFVAMHRESDGSLRTEGLNFLMGQEFLLLPAHPASAPELARIAMRLVDWLVAHGPVVQPSQAVLAGSGTVLLEVEGGDRIVARCA